MEEIIFLFFLEKKYYLTLLSVWVTFNTLA